MSLRIGDREELGNHRDAAHDLKITMPEFQAAMSATLSI